jgi:hypothetical protein
MNTIFSVGRGLLPKISQKQLIRALIVATAVAVVMLTGAALVGAEEEQLPDRFGLRLGGYNIRDANTIMRLDANNVPVGTYIDFQNTLGGETTATVFRADGFYRFNEHHSIGFSWYDLHFTGQRVLTADISWGDQTFTKDTQVNSELRFDIVKLNYQYSVYHNDKVELGASIGFHIDHITAGISAGSSQAQSQAITAPLPVLGLFADYNFTPRFSAYYNYQFFFFNYQNKVRGGLQDFLFGLEYRLFRNIGLGAAYNRFGANLKVEGDTTTLYLDSNWNGGMLYAAVYF